MVATYIYQAATKGMNLNALADIMFIDAIEEAKICDLELRQGKTRGILHGIPISIKDMLKHKGTISCGGNAAMIDKFFYEDGSIV